MTKVVGDVQRLGVQQATFDFNGCSETTPFFSHSFIGSCGNERVGFRADNVSYITR